MALSFGAACFDFDLLLPAEGFTLLLRGGAEY
jgi:hypothetical protein